MREAREPALLGKFRWRNSPCKGSVQTGDGSKVRGQEVGWVQALTEMGSNRGLWNTGPG